MELDLILLGLTIFIVGFVFGWLNHAKLIFNRLIENPDSIFKIVDQVRKSRQSKIEQEVLSNVHELEIDCQNGIYYLYNKTTGQFLAQADKLADALELVAIRFPGKQFQGHIPKEQADAWGTNKEIEQTK